MTDHYLIGAMGGRADHALINLRLVYQHPGKVILLDDQNRIEAYSAGVYADKKRELCLHQFLYR
jgi:thiamine pyrophosphokinase